MASRIAGKGSCGQARLYYCLQDQTPHFSVGSENLHQLHFVCNPKCESLPWIFWQFSRRSFSTTTPHGFEGRLRGNYCINLNMSSLRSLCSNKCSRGFTSAWASSALRGAWENKRKNTPTSVRVPKKKTVTWRPSTLWALGKVRWFV